MIFAIGQASAVDSQRITKTYMFRSRARREANQIDSELKASMTKRCDFSVNELCSKNDSKPSNSKPDIDPDTDVLKLLKSMQSEVASLRTEVRSLENVKA